MNNLKRTAVTGSLGFMLLALLNCHQKLAWHSHKRNTITNYQQLNDSTLTITGISADPEFGYTEARPIMLGMVDVHKAAENVEKYLNALRGPSGEPVKYYRLKPCCPFKTKNFRYTIPVLGKEFNGKRGLLEQYRIEYSEAGTIKSTILFLNLYDQTNQLLAPEGFTYKTI
ncbi:hypothetical protein [Ohtaekwangia sp.]|uniref:hypothetical protein n=1 Tax=Ohtaekwangia sp. TaxID=2066019 RepID=UPI002F953C94